MDYTSDDAKKLKLLTSNGMDANRALQIVKKSKEQPVNKQNFFDFVNKPAKVAAEAIAGGAVGAYEGITKGYDTFIKGATEDYNKAGQGEIGAMEQTLRGGARTLKYVGSDIVGGTIGGAIKGAVKGVTTPEQREFLKQKAGEAYQAIEPTVNKVKGVYEENVSPLNRERIGIAGEGAMGAVDFLTAGLGKQGGKQLIKQGEKAVEMGAKYGMKGAEIATDAYKGGKQLIAKAGEKIPTISKEPLQNAGNAIAERALSAQWKLDKPTRTFFSENLGTSGPKYALEKGLVGKSIEDTADNAIKMKYAKMQEKLDAVKQLGVTQTPEVAVEVANTLKTSIKKNIIKSLKASGKEIKDMTDEQIMMYARKYAPQYADVYDLADNISNAKQASYVDMEKLKELHDYLNPEGVKYDIKGRAVNVGRDLLSTSKRSGLQKILEEAGASKGFDIKGINKDIQSAHALSKGLGKALGRIENLNMFGLGDTQTAVISAILGGAPAALGGILLKKGLTSEGFVSGLAKKLYTKGKDVISNSIDNSVSNPVSKSRLSRILDNASDNSIGATKTVEKGKPLLRPKQ